MLSTGLFPGRLSGNGSLGSESRVKGQRVTPFKHWTNSRGGWHRSEQCFFHGKSLSETRAAERGTVSQISTATLSGGRSEEVSVGMVGRAAILRPPLPRGLLTHSGIPGPPGQIQSYNLPGCRTQVVFHVKQQGNTGLFSKKDAMLCSSLCKNKRKSDSQRSLNLTWDLGRSFRGRGANSGVVV